MSLFFFNDTATTEIYTLSLHDALPISSSKLAVHACRDRRRPRGPAGPAGAHARGEGAIPGAAGADPGARRAGPGGGGGGRPTHPAPGPAVERAPARRAPARPVSRGGFGR